MRSLRRASACLSFLLVPFLASAAPAQVIQVAEEHSEARDLSALGSNTLLGDRLTFNDSLSGAPITSTMSRGDKGPFAIRGMSLDFPTENAAIAFDTRNPSPDHLDLGTPNVFYGGPGVGIAGGMMLRTMNSRPLAKALVLAAQLIDIDSDGLVDVPCDSKVAGTLEFDFSSVGKVNVYSMVVLDVENISGVSEVEFFDDGDNLITRIPIPETGDNGVRRVNFGAVMGVVRMVIQVRGSGAFDNIRFDCDCNMNGIPDPAELENGTAADINLNGMPDDCEPDCNSNGIPDEYEVGVEISPDADGNGLPDDCDPDCDMNGLPDVLDPDCDTDGIPDACAIADGAPDCNGNGIPDVCELIPDCNANGVPDECELTPDCNSNGILDVCELASDCNSNGIPDVCELTPDCNSNGIPDICELTPDCNANGVPDECESTPDCNLNGIPDECELTPDCNSNGIPDVCELTPDCNTNGIPDDCESTPDCNSNGIPDECDVNGGSSNDADGNGQPDECDPDCDGDGEPDAVEPDCDGDGVPDDCDDDQVPDSYCVEGAATDSYYSYTPHQHGLWFFDELGRDYQTVGRVEFEEFPSGDARLTGVFARASDPTQQFFADVSFRDLVEPGDANYPPFDSPKTDGLDPSAFIANGGPVDTATWHYYEETDGVLVGLNALQGALYLVERRGPSLQVGFGANVKNVEFGVSGWFDATLLDQPDSGPSLPLMMDGDFNLTVVDCPSEMLLDRCVDNGIGDTSLGKSSTSGMWIPALGTSYDFAEQGTYMEFPDGTASLQGRVIDRDNPTRGFEVNAFFGDRVDPGDVSYPPAGSPKATLDDGAYVPLGPADPGTWHYYEVTVGCMIGFGEFEGATLLLSRRGEAFQVGLGANERNLQFGGSGWIDFELISSPTSGASIPLTFNGDINVELPNCPDPCQPLILPLVHYPFDEQLGDICHDPMNSLDLVLDEGNGGLNWISDAFGTGLQFDQTASGTACVRTATNAEATGLKDALVAAGEFTVQVHYSQDPGSHGNARLVTFSSGTPVADRNFSLMAYEANGDMTSQVRLRTTSSTLQGVVSDIAPAFAETVQTVTFDQSTGVVRTYINGVLVGTWSHGGTLDAWVDRSLVLGNEATLDRPFRGVLYDVKIWARSLDATEVASEASSL